MGQKLKFERDHGGREKYVRVDRRKDYASDCVIRSISIAMGQDWKDTYKGLVEVGLELCRLPNEKEVFELYLERNGWKKKPPYRNAKRETVELRDFPAAKGETYIISVRQHVVCVMDRVVRDTWWCGEYRANSYFVKE